MFVVLALALALGVPPKAQPAPNPAALMGLRGQAVGGDVYEWDTNEWLAYDRMAVFGNCASERHRILPPPHGPIVITCDTGDPPQSMFCLIAVMESPDFNIRYFGSVCDGGVIVSEDEMSGSLRVYGEETTESQFMLRMAQNLMGTAPPCSQR